MSGFKLRSCCTVIHIFDLGISLTPDALPAATLYIRLGMGPVLQDRGSMEQYRNSNYPGGERKLEHTRI